MASDRCFHGVYWFFLLVSVILLAAAGAIPTWFNSDSSNGSCGPITYSLDRTQADSIHLWNEQVWEYDAEYWMFSAFALAAAGTLLLLACIASLCVSCCCSCCVSAIAFMLGTATLATLASVVLFAGGLPDTTLVDGSNDEPRTPSVFDVCPCERAAAFDAGTCAFGLGLLLGAASAVSMFIATGMECLLRDTRTRQVYPISDEERMFYE